MAVVMYGSLLDSAVCEALDNAKASPKAWSVYLVDENAGTRTSAQNMLYRRTLRRLAQQQGQSVQYWHEYLVERFLGFDEIRTEDGYTRKVLASTSDLSVADFTAFLNACLAFAAELQVH